MTMPGRICVAGIAIRRNSLFLLGEPPARETPHSGTSLARGSRGKDLILHVRRYPWEIRKADVSQFVQLCGPTIFPRHEKGPDVSVVLLAVSDLAMRERQ
jgi:hypothetical protein